tara:strand:+ start:150 stop:1082 length:933 start_codon:yes stop_codon:yes gene_type:complete
MSNSIQDFISQLKKIDVGNLLEKAKTVKVEDIKNIKFSDLSKIKDSKYFYPISGFLFASLFTILTTIPTYKSMKSTIDKSKRYSYEANNLELLNTKLDDTKQALEKMNNTFPEVSKLVISDDSLVYLTKIIDESAIRSAITISQFRPINEQELQACSSLSEEERAADLQSSFANNDIPMPIDDLNFDQESGFDDLENGDMEFSNQKSVEEIESLLNYSKITDSLNIDSPLAGLKNDIEEGYKSNYYEIMVTADYINILKFLKSIQEYELFIIPYCFYPMILANQNNNEFNQVFRSNGEVKTKIILNIPTK